MAGGCEQCGVSMQSPCSIICLVDCSVCWCAVVAAEEVAHPVAGFAQVKLKAGPDPVLDGTSRLKLCNTDLTLEQIAKLFDHLHPTAAITAPATQAASVVSGVKTGTLDELIDRLGLVATPYAAA